LEKILMLKSILIVAECFYPEEFKINDIALSWKRKGYIVDVLTSTPTYPEGKVFSGYRNKFFYKDHYQGINIYRVFAITGYKESLLRKLLRYLNFMIIGGIASLFFRRKYDCILGFNTGSLTSMLPAVIISKVKKVPLTLWVQDLWPESVYAYGFKKTRVLSFLLKGFVKKIYRSANSIAITSQGFEKIIKLYLKNDIKVHYIPNWPDELDLNLKPYKFNNEQKINFTFAGNIGRIQNLDNIMIAFSSLPKKYLKKAQLNIIGDGTYLENLKLKNECENIIFYGKKPREDMGRYYNGSNFLIVSLIDEPIFSLTVPAKTQTYILANKPILAIINGETAQLVRNNNLGYCAKPNDLDDIRKIFTKSIDSSSNALSRFTKNSKSLLEEKFDKEKIINSLEAVLIN